MSQRNLIKRYIHHRSLLVKGHGELSLAVSVFNYAMLLWLTLRDVMTFSRFYVLLIVPGMFVAVVIIQYIIGWIWERKKLVNEELDWQGVRNPVLEQILKQFEKYAGICPKCKMKGFGYVQQKGWKCCFCGYEEPLEVNHG